MIVEWHHSEGLTFAEIEDVLGIPYTTVVGRYQRAPTLLRSKLSGRLMRQESLWSRNQSSALALA